MDHHPFQLFSQPSTIEGAGMGLFVCRKQESPDPLVIPSGALLGWYGGSLLPERVWIRRYAGGNAVLGADAEEESTAAASPKDYTFFTPLGPLAWMCKKDALQKSISARGQEEYAEGVPSGIPIRLVHPSVLPQSECTVGGVPASSIREMASAREVSGHRMNDRQGFILKKTQQTTPPDSRGGVNVSAIDLVKQALLASLSGERGVGSGESSPAVARTNNAKVLRDIVYAVTEPSVCSDLGITHVCPVVVGDEPIVVSSSTGRDGRVEVELTTSYGAPYWVSRALHDLFYRDGEWEVARALRRYAINELAVCREEDLAPLPCPVAVVMPETGDTVSFEPAAMQLLIRQEDESFEEVGDGEEDVARLRLVLAAIMCHDPAVYRLPINIVHILLKRLVSVRGDQQQHLPLVKQGYKTLGTYYH